MRNLKVLSIILSIICVLNVSACTKKKGPVEKAGERIDEIVDNVKEGEAPLKRKGPLEKAGESIDEALDSH